MSDNEKTTQPASTDSTEPAYRYNAALAQDIEGKWQKIWDDKGTFWAANVNGDLKDGKGRNADGRPAYFAMDMFPYPSGKGLHVGHPLGYLASDVVSRYHRMKGENVLHAMGYDAFGLPAEQYAVQTGQHPRVTTLANIANMSRQLHRMGLSFDDRRSFATIDPGYVRWTQWIFSRIYDSWYDEDAVNPSGSKGSARPVSELVAKFESGEKAIPGHESDGKAWADLDQAEQQERLPPGLHLQVPGQLVPGAGHRARQRGGHRRRQVRTRQLPGLPARAAPVVDAHHQVRPPPHRGP